MEIARRRASNGKRCESETTLLYLGTSLCSVYGKFSIQQFILAPQLSHLTFQVLHALLEACNLRVLGLLAFPPGWLAEQWLWRRQFSQVPNFLGKICMARVIEKRLGNVGEPFRPS